jgi:hypothetical protein
VNPALLVMAKAPAAAGGGITFPITGVTTTYSASRSPSFTLGTAPATDDIIVVSIATQTTYNTTDTSGWDNVLGANTITQSDSNGGIMLYHRVTSAESGGSTVSWTLTNIFDATETGRIIADVLRGVATSGELVGGTGGFSSANTATPWVIPSVTPSASSCQVVAMVTGDGTETQTEPGGWTTMTSGTGTIGLYTYSLDALGTSGVPTGTTNVTPSAGNEFVAIAAAFKPA